MSLIDDTHLAAIGWDLAAFIAGTGLAVTGPRVSWGENPDNDDRLGWICDGPIPGVELEKRTFRSLAAKQHSTQNGNKSLAPKPPGGFITPDGDEAGFGFNELVEPESARQNRANVGCKLCAEGL
jgi:hypothetical protein